MASSKAPVKLSGLAGKKIESPLAKYNSAGQLTCIVCNTVIKSEMVWTAHVNGRQHKEKVVALKQSKTADDTAFVKPPPVPAVKRKGDSEATPSPSKKGIPSDFFDQPPSSGPIKQQPKPVRGILKNAPKPVPVIPDTEMEVESSSNVTQVVAVEKQATVKESSHETRAAGELPEGFFDDPKLDAKVRQIEFKDPVEEEWEKFQKEIHDEVMVSTAIQEEDQEESTATRQLEEIEEQMMNWNRVLQLEQKKDIVIQKLQAARTSSTFGRDQSSSEDEADVDELFDWRSKAT